MPPYDPKANRPKVAPTEESAPVDALLGPAAGEDLQTVDLTDGAASAGVVDPVPSEPAPSDPPRGHLSLVPDGAAPRVVPDPPSGRRGDPRVFLLLAGVVAVGVVAVAIAFRRRD